MVGETETGRVRGGSPCVYIDSAQVGYIREQDGRCVEPRVQAQALRVRAVTAEVVPIDRDDTKVEQVRLPALPDKCDSCPVGTPVGLHVTWIARGQTRDPSTR